MKIRGVIFDMDGVLLDSEKLYIRFWCEAGQACGYPFEVKHALAIRSLARPYAIERLRGFFGDSFDYDVVRNKRIELMSAYVDEYGIETKPYAEYVLNVLKKRGIKTALATATPPERAEKYLSAVSLLDYFDEIVCASMVKNGKPAPDIYLYAASKLGLEPSECMAVEDSPNGVESASAAGCVTVMVPDMDEPDEKTRDRVFVVVESLKYIEELL